MEFLPSARGAARIRDVGKDGGLSACMRRHALSKQWCRVIEIASEASHLGMSLGR